MDKLQSYEIFTKLVETKSFTKTAKYYYMSQPNVTRILSELEKAIGIQLIFRNTRSFNLTENGTIFYRHCKSVLEEIHRFEESFTGDESQLSGIINITVPIFFRGVFYQVFGKFLDKHPRINIRLSVTNTYVDLVENNLDMAVQVGDGLDGESGKDALSSRKKEHIGDRQMMFLTSPAYAKKHGVPKHPKELAQHKCLVFSLKSHATWTYCEHDVEKSIDVHGSLTSTIMVPVFDCVMNGYGIAYLPRYYVNKELSSGALIEILKPFRPKPDPIYVSHGYTVFVPKKIQIFTQFLKESQVFSRSK